MSLTLRTVTSARLLSAAARTRPFCTGTDDSGGDSKNDLKKLLKKHKLKEKTTPPAPATATNEESQSKPESNAKLNDLLLKLNEKRAASKQNEAIKMTKPNIVLEDDLDPVSMKGVDPEVVVAAHKVSTHLAKDDRVETKRIESDLVKRLRTIAEDTDSNREAMAGGEKGPDLAQMLSTFKVDKGKTAEKVNLTEDQMDFLERRRQLRKAKGVRGGRQEAAAGPAQYDRSKGIFGGEPLGIFPMAEPTTGDGEVVRLETWERCEERYLRLMSTPTPRNYLEEMVDLTEKGIMWQFPIDNEQGIDHDELEPFHEHVFLEHHIEDWCPTTGPVRHFMEVVCVGLQRNPYITVEKKVSHLEWFKNYFQDAEKMEILKISGAMDN